MKKLLRAVLNWIKGHELDVKEQRVIDDALHEIKIGVLTLIVVTSIGCLIFSIIEILSQKPH